MNDHEIRQRISYLIEHGGLWEDPLAEIRSTARRAVWLAGAAVLVGVIDLVLLAS